jgi:hypothetical protein
MAETQTASTGYNGEVWIHNGTILYELVGVTGFKPPNQSRERIDASTLKDLRPVTIGGRYVDGEVTVGLIYRPESTTDTMLSALVVSQEAVDMKLVIPAIDGDPAQDLTFDGRVIGYEVDDLSAESAMTATLTIEVVGAVTKAASA